MKTTFYYVMVSLSLILIVFTITFLVGYNVGSKIEFKIQESAIKTNIK